MGTDNDYAKTVYLYLNNMYFFRYSLGRTLKYALNAAVNLLWLS